MTSYSNSAQLLSPYWHIVNIKLANWGIFSGLHTIDVAWKGEGKGSLTEIHGESGSGKSTIIDQLTVLLMEAGKPLNKASENESGAKSRSISTYVKGLVGTYGEAGYEKERYLRGEDPPSDTWSMITATFMNSTGGIITIGGIFWVPKGEKDPSRTIWVLADSDLNIEEMGRRADKPFTKAIVREAYPDAIVVSESKREMRREWHVRTGMTEEAEELLYRILTSSHDTDVNATFRSIVLDRPETIEMAEELVGELDVLLDNSRRRRREGERIEALNFIETLNDSYVAARESDAAYCSWAKDHPDAEDVQALERWFARRILEHAEAALADAGESVAAGRRLLERLREESSDAEKAYDELNTLFFERGGGRILELENKLGVLENELKDASNRRREAERSFGKVEESMPTNRGSWEARKRIAEEAALTRDERRRVIREKWADARSRAEALGREIEELRKDHAVAQETGKKIGRERIGARALLAEYSGIPEEQIPYAAELMDFLPGEERWRAAAHVRYGSLADTILIDKRHEFEFDRKVGTIEAAELQRRCRWRFVDITRSYASNRSDGWLSSRMKFDGTSPFSGWLESVVSDENHDAILKETADDFEDIEEAQITPTGQTKEKNRGAHGSSKSGFGDFIGYCDKGYLEELEEEIVRAITKQQAALRDKERYEREEVALDSESELLNLFRTLTWESVDTATLEHNIEMIRAQIEEARHTDGLEEISYKLEAAKKKHLALLEESAKTGASLDNSVKREEHLKCRVAQIAQKAEATSNSIDPPAGLLEQFDTAWDTSIGGNVGSIVGNAELCVERVKAIKESIHAGAIRARRAVNDKAAPLKLALLDYKSKFADPGTEASTFGCEPEDARHYVALPHDEDWRAGLALDQSQAIWKIVAHLAEFFDKTKRYEEGVREKVEAISDILSRFDYNADGTRLHLIPRFDRTGVFYRFNSSLLEIIKEYYGEKNVKYYTELEESEREDIIGAIKDVVDQMRIGKDYPSGNVYCVDPRRRFIVTVQARKPNGEAESLGSYGGKSGGEKEKTMAFVYGAAILYALGGAQDELPRFAPIILDEAFVRSDAKYTVQAIEALKGLGFQLILSCPDNKIATISPLAERTWGIRKDDDWNVVLIPDAMEGQC